MGHVNSLLFSCFALTWWPSFWFVQKALSQNWHLNVLGFSPWTIWVCFDRLVFSLKLFSHMLHLCIAILSCIINLCLRILHLNVNFLSHLSHWKSFLFWWTVFMWPPRLPDVVNVLLQWLQIKFFSFKCIACKCRFSCSLDASIFSQNLHVFFFSRFSLWIFEIRLLRYDLTVKTKSHESHFRFLLFWWTASMWLLKKILFCTQRLKTNQGCRIPGSGGACAPPVFRTLSHKNAIKPDNLHF